MRKILLPLLLFSCALTSHGQGTARQEFNQYTNGLMYSDADMRALRFVVDSLNLRFKTCDLDRQYYSNVQSRALYVRFSSDTNNLKEVLSAVQQNMSYQELISRYKNYVVSVDSFQLVVRTDKNDKKSDYNYLYGTPVEGYSTFYRDDKNKNKEPVGNWQYDYREPGQYTSGYGLTCRFYPNKWQAKPIPEKYARLIQYVDCMIDTSAYVYLNKPDKTEDPGKAVDNLDIVCKYIDKKLGKKHKKHYGLDNEQLTYLREHLQKDEDIRRLIESSLDDCIESGQSNFYLAAAGQALGFYEKALTMKRGYRPVGMCSQDNTPREHAKDIAVLAAQSHSWDIFLRSHLDIMNDRFSRMSDGNYAWGGRQTYLKELEELNINVIDLMLGLTLRAQNVASNHYYGSISRLGRALAESKDQELFTQKAIEMIKDESLDEFNRGLVFLLYYSYTSYLPKAEGKAKRDLLRNTANEYPAFLRVSIAQMKDYED